MIEEKRTLLPQAVYARRIGLTPIALQKHIANGKIELHGPKRLVWVEDADQKMKEGSHPSYDHRRKWRIPGDSVTAGAAPEPIADAASENAPNPDRATLHESRTVKAREDARRAKIAREKEEIELAELKGAMVSVEDVSRDVALVYAHVRTRLLALPVELAAKIAVKKGVLQIKAALDDAIRGALEKLADTIADGHFGAGATDGGEQFAATAPKTKRGKVGRPKRIFVT